MPSDETEGRQGPRATTLFALVLTLLLVAPSALFGAVSTRPLGLSAPEVLLPVLRPVAVPVVEAASLPPAKTEITIKLEARTLLAMFQEQDYFIDQVRSGDTAVPRLVLTDLPKDLGALDSVDDRKSVFVKTMLPLVLMANEQIQADRARLEKLQAVREAGQDLAPQDQRWVLELADRYGANLAPGGDLKPLLRKVDVVPPSLALAQAAEESGWGTSRVAQKGNVLFGQTTLSQEHKGITPRNRAPGETWRYRAFDDPKAAVEAYVHNLNTHQAYSQFRAMRASLRKQGKPLEGIHLAAALEKYSERGLDYVKTIRTLIRKNGLQDFDDAVLRQDGPEQVVRPEPAGVQQVSARR